MCGGPISTKAAKQREMDYRAEDDHRTLTRAEEIRADAARMAGVRRHHRKQSRAISRMNRVVNGRGRRA